MTRMRTRTLAIAALALGIVTAGGPASALSIRNCTDINIRVNVYKGKDKLRLKPVRGGKAAISKGKLYKFRIGKGGYQIRAYRSKKLTPRILEQGGLHSNRVYSVIGKEGHYSVSANENCPPPGVNLLPVNGLWSTPGRKDVRQLRIKRRTPDSFDVTFLPDGKPRRFEGGKGNQYISGYTTSIIVISEARIKVIDHLILNSETLYRFERP